MQERLIRGAGYLILFAAAAGVFGCASSVDEARIVEIEDEMIDLSDAIEAIKMSVQDLSDDIEEISGWIKEGSQAAAPSPETAKQIAQLESRTVALETKLNSANSEIKSLTSRLKTAEQKMGSYSAASYSADEPKTSSTAVSPPPKPEAPVTVGYHYAVQEGETVESIAQKTGVSASSIRNSNQPALSGTRQPVANTLIWIPGPRKN